MPQIDSLDGVLIHEIIENLLGLLIGHTEHLVQHVPALAQHLCDGLNVLVIARRDDKTFGLQDSLLRHKKPAVLLFDIIHLGGHCIQKLLLPFDNAAKLVRTASQIIRNEGHCSRDDCKKLQQSIIELLDLGRRNDVVQHNLRFLNHLGCYGGRGNQVILLHCLPGHSPQLADEKCNFRNFDGLKPITFIAERLFRPEFCYIPVSFPNLLIVLLVPFRDGVRSHLPGSSDSSKGHIKGSVATVVHLVELVVVIACYHNQFDVAHIFILLSVGWHILRKRAVKYLRADKSLIVLWF